MNPRSELVPVEGGHVPVTVLGPSSNDPPALVVVPSIFGPAPDLLQRLAPLAASALIVAPDPFWRIEAGAIPYGDVERARKRVQSLDLPRCFVDIRAVIDWAHARSNGRVIGLGICFGGPIVLLAAADHVLAGAVTWHGSRMDAFLSRANEIRCPLRLHFGAADPLTPPETIDKIRVAFAAHPDLDIVLHMGCGHGYSHDGHAYDAQATRAGIDAVRELLMKHG